MDFAQYVQAFNASDDAELVNRFFADDVVVSNGVHTLRGARELLNFLEGAHEGIRSFMRPKIVLGDDNHVFAEIDMEFHAKKDMPDFAFGALKKGEFTTVRYFALYDLRDGKIAAFRSATWPVQRTATHDAPRLGGSIAQRQAFRDYTEAFSNGDFERFTRYYTDDVTLELSTVGVIKTPKGIADFYRAMFKTVREKLTIHHLIADESGIAADITTAFTAIEDAPDFVVAPLKKGQSVRGRVFVHYTLRDGKIAHIKVARAGEMNLSG